MAPFPLIKLGYLAIRQISKPIANYIKRQAKSSPFIRTWICMPPAQLYHWWEVNIHLRMMGLGKAKNVEKLTDKEAIELGGEMLGEFIIFSVAAVILVLEYQRGARREAAKEEKLDKELSGLKTKVEEMKTVSDIQKSQIRDLQKSLDYYAGLLKPSNEKATASANSDLNYVKQIFGSKQ
ncbi:optic atrophy 3 protein homolog [Plakobranchus ocellatus]|uniref:Optic atrophy 3 protein homolog n=1 Tax=Plakobranchus ocellatus TaxID=259542 RepID=A0AAV4E269_9GAST|nr:optic atrophy 3 protein homolog [Plakobranchus ocellatus]